MDFPNLSEKQKSTVSLLLRAIVRWVVHCSSWNIHSIILLGSLPSGWGYFPLGDLDIMVVTRVYDPMMPYRVRRALRAVVAPCKVEVSQWPRSVFLASRSVSVYDLRSTGRVIYGDKEVLRAASQWQAIPKYEALRYLFNIAVVNLVSSLARGFVGNAGDASYLPAETVYCCNKAYLAICAALLIFEGEYRIGYENRARVFESLYRTRYDRLRAEIPHLAARVAAATAFKLEESAPSSFDLPSLNQALTDICTVMKYCINRYFGTSYQDSLILLRLLKKLPPNLVNRLYYFQRYTSTFLRPPPASSFFVEPITSVYIAAGCLLLAAESNTLSPFLEAAMGEIKGIYSPCPSTGDGWENWDRARRICKLLLPEKLLIPQWRYRKDPMGQVT